MYMNVSKTNILNVLGIGLSQPLSKECRCIVTMWVSGFGRLMQLSLTPQVHELVNGVGQTQHSIALHEKVY